MILFACFLSIILIPAFLFTFAFFLPAFLFIHFIFTIYCFCFVISSVCSAPVFLSVLCAFPLVIFIFCLFFVWPFLLYGVIFVLRFHQMTHCWLNVFLYHFLLCRLFRLIFHTSHFALNKTCGNVHSICTLRCIVVICAVKLLLQVLVAFRIIVVYRLPIDVLLCCKQTEWSRPHKQAQIMYAKRLLMDGH